MFTAVIELSLRYKFLVLIIFGVVAFIGWRAVTIVPIDAFPDVTPAQVNIYTESPGLAAEDVEQLLTFPIESGLAGLPKVPLIVSVEKLISSISNSVPSELLPKVSSKKVLS